MTRKLLLAFGLAGAAMLALYAYSVQLRHEFPGGDMENILVAAVDVKPGERLKRDHLGFRSWPMAYAPPDHYKKGGERELLGQQVTQTIKQGQPIVSSHFDLQPSDRLSKAIPKGQRAYTLPVDASGSLAGMLRPGDHVDVLGTFARNQGDTATVTLLQNVRVLAIGGERSREGENENQKAFGTITVAVDLEEAELLTFAVQRGPISIALRRDDDSETTQDVPDKNFGDIFETQRRSAFSRRHAQQKIEALKPQ